MSSSDTKYCARHPKVETAIACASCGTPICPDCMVVTPVGMKCRDCGLQRGGTLFQVGLGRLILAAIVAMAAGAGAVVLSSIGGFFIFFIAAPYGYFVGTLIMKSAGMKRGIRMEITAGAGMMVGALLCRLLPVALVAISTGVHLPASAYLIRAASLWYLITVAIATACAISKIRYL